MLTLIHDRLAQTMLLYVSIVAVWGLWRFFRRQGADSSYMGALAIAEILILVQGLAGAYLFFIDGVQPARGGVHILYGVASALVIPAIYAYTRNDKGEDRRVSLIYGVALLFLAALVVRGIVTGG